VQGTSGAAFDDAVSPNGLPTTAFYQYGLDARYRGHATTGIVYDQSTPPQSVGSDFTAHQIHASVSGLVPNALYHFRLVANNSSGTVFGPDQTFTTAKDVAPPAPVLGKVVNVKPVSGVVFIKPPKGKSLGKLSHARGLAAVVKGTGFLPLTEARQIPSGSQIDARQGSLQVTAAPAGKSGKTQVGTFGGGIFKLAQDRRKTTKGLTTMSLLEGDFPGAPSYVSCGAKAHTTSGGSPAQAARKRRKLSSKVLQTLRSSVKGNFRTRGRYSAATVRGTAWDMSDRCDGTLTVVHKGTVDVLDSVLHKTVRVHAGHRYLASAVKPPKAKPKRKHK
jgi:hypothetical protein